MLIATNSCTDGPNFSLSPEIEFVSFSKDTLQQGSVNNDFVDLVISFTDGDGDLGYPSTSGVLEQDLVLIDNRTGNVFDRFKTPEIPDQGTGNGVKGTMMIKVFTICCTYPENIPDCEPNPPIEYSFNELSFDITLTDRAGNASNTITTPTLQLQCR